MTGGLTFSHFAPEIGHRVWLVSLTLLLAACGGGGSSIDDFGTTSSSTVYSATAMAPSANCPNGGIQVDSGIDENGNGVLDPGEMAER